MTDKATRLAQRSGPALVERLRADELPAYTTARTRRGQQCANCRHSVVSMGGACRCRRPVPCDHMDVVRLLAFCGVEEAREIVGVYGLHAPHEFESYWIPALQRLAAKLPPKRVEVACPHEAHDPNGVSGVTECPRCADDPPTLDAPAETWLRVVAALAVARECLRVEFACDHASEDDHGCWDCQNTGYANLEGPKIEDALDACQAWVTEPTEANCMEWNMAADHPRPDLPRWVPRSWSVDSAIEAAADLLTPERAKELARHTIVGVVL